MTSTPGGPFDVILAWRLVLLYVFAPGWAIGCLIGFTVRQLILAVSLAVILALLAPLAFTAVLVDPVSATIAFHANSISSRASRQ